MASQIIAGTSGFTITLTTGLDTTSASARRIYWRTPRGAEGYWTATASGTTGIVYTTTAGDIPANSYGTWSMQAYVDFGSGRVLRSDAVPVYVGEPVV